MIRIWLLKSIATGVVTGGAIQAVAAAANDSHTQLLLGLFSMVAALGVAGITAFATITVSRRSEEARELRKQVSAKERIIKRQARELKEKDATIGRLRQEQPRATSDGTEAV